VGLLLNGVKNLRSKDFWLLGASAQFWASLPKIIHLLDKKALEGSFIQTDFTP